MADPGSQTASEDEPKPTIWLLSLWKRLDFDNKFIDLVRRLQAKATVMEIVGRTEASRVFNSSETPKPIVFATDVALCEDGYDDQQKDAIRFVHNGGTLIFGAYFPDAVKTDNIGWMFSRFGLSWRPRYRENWEWATNIGMNHFDVHEMVPFYSQRALVLAGVTKGDAVYLLRNTDVSQDRTVYAPAACAKVGQGWVGCIGGLEAHEDTTKVALAMCGLSGFTAKEREQFPAYLEANEYTY